jgi:hypothetical protein
MSKNDWSGSFDIDSIGGHVARLQNGHLLYIEVKSEAFLHENKINLDDGSSGDANGEVDDAGGNLMSKHSANSGTAANSSSSTTGKSSQGTILVVFHACIPPDALIAVPGVMGFRIKNNTWHEFTLQENRKECNRAEGYVVEVSSEGYTSDPDLCKY